MNVRIDPADNSKFLEQFRYSIVASQLLGSHAVLGPPTSPTSGTNGARPNGRSLEPISTTGVLLAIAGACAIALFSSWLYQGGISAFTRKRTAFMFMFAGIVVILLVTHAKRQRLRYLRDQVLSEASAFISMSQDFDSATAAAIALIQEVELVSRGYRL